MSEMRKQTDDPELEALICQVDACIAYGSQVVEFALEETLTETEKDAQNNG